MAQGSNPIYYRNRTSTDTTTYQQQSGLICYTIEATGFTNPGYKFIEWNNNRAGTGTSYHPGDSLYEGLTIYAIWAAANDITVTKNTTSGSERWDIQYTADQAGTIDKTLLTAGKLMDRNEKVSITIPSGTDGTPIATKGTVSNNSISVTPSVTNVTGFITGGTKTGTAVTVSASELVSGTKNITASGTTDVTNYANASVGAMTLPTSTSTTSSGTNKTTIGRSTSTRYINIPTGYNDSAAYYTISAVANGSATTPNTTIYSIPTMSIDSTTGIVSAVNNESQSVTPTVSEGYVSSGTAGTITVSGGASMSLSTQAAKIVTPSTSNQTAVAAGKYTLGAITVEGSANLLAENIKENVTIFGVTGSFAGGDLPPANGEDF